VTRRVRVLVGIATLIAVALVGAAIAGAKSGQQNSHRSAKVTGKPGHLRPSGTLASHNKTKVADEPEAQSEEPEATDDDPADAQEHDQTAAKSQVGDDDQGEQDNSQADEDDQAEEQKLDEKGANANESSTGAAEQEHAGPADSGNDDGGGEQGDDGGD
jgi:cell division protein FtsN